LALSETISTTGTSPRTSAASKSSGTTTTGSLNVERRSRASKSAGASLTT
jgi:hypothetical protein